MTSLLAIRRTTQLPVIKVSFFQGKNIPRNKRFDPAELIGTARCLGICVNCEVLDKAFNRKNSEPDLLIVNFFGLSKTKIEQLDRLTAEKLAEKIEAGHSINTGVIVYDPTQVKKESKYRISFNPPPIVRAMFEGKFLEAAQGGFLVAVSKVAELKKSFLDALTKHVETMIAN